MIDISKIKPPHSLDRLKKVLGVGIHKKLKHSIVKSLRRKHHLTDYPFSVKMDKKTNKLILTYTKFSPKKKKNGGYVRDFNHNIDMEKINDEEYTPYELPFNKNTFHQFVEYLIPFQKKIIQQNTKTLNTYQSNQNLIDDYVEEYLISKKGDVNRKTFMGYTNLCNHFLRFWKRNDNKKMNIVGEYEIDRLLKENPNLEYVLDNELKTNMKLEDFSGVDGRKLILLYKKRISMDRDYNGIIYKGFQPNSIKGYVGNIKWFFNWCVNNRYLMENPFNYIKPNDLPNYQKNNRRVREKLTPTDYDIEMIWEWIKNEKDNPQILKNKNPKINNMERWGWFLPMLVIYLKSGIRNNTLCLMERKNVDWKNNRIKYKSKGDIWGEIWLDDELKEWLKPILFDDKGNKKKGMKYIFENGKQQQYKSTFISMKFQKMIKEIHSTNPSINENITPHSCRRYFINKHIRDGKSLSMIRKSVNHSNYDILRRYEEDTMTDSELSQSTLHSPLNIDRKDEIQKELENHSLKIEELQKELKTI